MIKISTEFIYPPIPIRNFDWCAIDENTYNGDKTDPIGFGKTRSEAVQDLLEKIEEDL